MIVSPSEELQNHPLWPGSILELSHRFGGGMLRSYVDQTIAAMERCDDLTPREKSLLAVLKRL
jgi:hypothetical protein